MKTVLLFSFILLNLSLATSAASAPERAAGSGVFDESGSNSVSGSEESQASRVHLLMVGQQISQVLTSDGVTEFQRASSVTYFRKFEGLQLGGEFQWNRLFSQSGNLEISTETQRLFGIAQKDLLSISENSAHSFKLFFSFAAGVVKSRITTDFGSSTSQKNSDLDLVGYAGLGVQAEMPNLFLPLTVSAELRLQSEKALSHVPFVAGHLKLGFLF